MGKPDNACTDPAVERTRRETLALEVGLLIIVLILISVTKAYVKRTAAAASEERRRHEPHSAFENNG